MNKLTKIGVSALCGSLAAVSAAHAGTMSVAGGATATYSSNEGDVTGNPIGMNSGITLTGSGELDNGTTFTLTLTQTDATAYSSGNIAIVTPGMGTFTIDQGAGGTGIDRYDDMMPTAWEETTGTSLGTGIQNVNGAAGSTNIEWGLSSDMLPEGMTAYIALAPRATGTKATDKASSSGAEGTKMAYDIAVASTGLADGLNVFAGYSVTETDEPAIVKSGDRNQRVLGATYAVGSVTVGYQWSRDNANNAAAASTAYYENDIFGVSFAVNDDLSISYGLQKSDRALANHTNVEAEAQSLQIAYSMGGASLKIAETQGTNVKYQSGSANDKDATTIALTLAF